MMKKRLLYFLALALLPFISCNNSQPGGTAKDAAQASETDQQGIEIYDSIAYTFLDPEAKIETLAQGFNWSEGPLWIDALQSLIFSDVPANKIYRWNEAEGLSVYLEPAGHTGEENKDSGRGPNGLMLDMENHLLICQHGDRRIARMDAGLKDPKPKFVTIADAYAGRPFNSPNDLAMEGAGNIYFTDPPYGLPESRTGAMGFNGVFRVSRNQDVTLLVDSLSMPNGIALSPDNKTLYINQSDPGRPVLYRYDIAADGSLKNGKILFDFTLSAQNNKGLPDGLKIHPGGNIFATGPGGVHVISPVGRPLALFKTVKATANCAFDAGYKYLYMTTTDVLMRVRLK